MSSEVPSEQLSSCESTKVFHGDEIVISGVAGRFPDSDNVRIFEENLMNKVDLVSDDDRRWKSDNLHLPQRTGKINHIEKFDATFFSVPTKQAHAMDPMSRTLLEHAYEAIVDAGVNVQQIRNSKTGVFVGCALCESETMWMTGAKTFEGLGLSGTSRSLLANRISFAFDLIGPSFALDSACSSSITVLELGYRYIKEGICDAALVCGSNLCLNPNTSIQFSKLGVLSPDGLCKTFDEKADGYVRGEAIVVFYLQKAKEAKRVYATIVHVKSDCDGFKQKGMTFPASNLQSRLMREFYAECNISPLSIDFVEAHGTATKIGDFEEANAIDEVYTHGRYKPLLLGSVKSNIGHTESASGLCGVLKTIIAMESGIIPPNLNHKCPRKDIKGFKEGRLKVVNVPMPFNSSYIAVNNLGFGGTKAHLLLKSNPKEKVNDGVPEDDLPRLVVASGRTENAVATILSDLENRPVDVEYVKLLHDLHSTEMKNHMFRGYTILPPSGVSTVPMRDVQETSKSGRPVCFVFSGMGSQWPGMGEALLRIPVFLKAIQKCDAALKPHNVDIFRIITHKDETMFDNIFNSFLGITAIQIGLFDVLISIGIEPDIIIGHSIGEIGCAYADGCFTTEQTILSSYYRGKVSIETKFICGAMAAVDLGHEELEDLCPADIVVACHNSSKNSTISGPAESVKAFLTELQEKNIFAKVVNTGNIAYQSQYIAPAGPKILKYLQKLLPNPKPRSKKWLSTALPIDRWETSVAKFASAEYFTNNLLSSVLFKETSALLPKDAITIELAPHGLMQAILKRPLSQDVTNIALTQRDSKDNCQILLQAIGKMFLAGLHPKIANLYPHVEYPVSRKTPMISPLIKWEHSENWSVPSFKTDPKKIPSEQIINLSLSEDSYKDLAGHIVDGRQFFAGTGCLELIWKYFAKMHCSKYDELPVVMEDIKLVKAVIIPKDGSVELTLNIQKGTGNFEVSMSGATIMTGIICICSNPEIERFDIKLIKDNDEKELMTSQDVYKELNVRGYQFSGLCQGIKSSNFSGSKGHIVWRKNWSLFMDYMLQHQILSKNPNRQPIFTLIEKLIIDPKYHYSLITDNKREIDFPIHTDKLFDVTVSGGVQFHGVKHISIPRRKLAITPVLEEYKFVPYVDQVQFSLREFVRLVIQVCIENCPDVKIKILEYINEGVHVNLDDLLFPWISEFLDILPLIKSEINIFYSKDNFEKNSLPINVAVVDPKKMKKDSSSFLVIGHRLLMTDSKDNLNMLLLELKKNGFILTREDASELKYLEEEAKNNNLNIILLKKCQKEMLILLKRKECIREKMSVVHVKNESFTWVANVQRIMKESIAKEGTEPTRILLVGQECFENGLIGLVNCLRREPGGEMVSAILIEDTKAPRFSLQDPLYKHQIEKNLIINVLRKNNCWGCYRHFPLSLSESKLVPQAWLTQAVQGDLNSLKWVEGPIRIDNGDNVLFSEYVAINSKDVMIATGRISPNISSIDERDQEFVYGFEFSGVDKLGKHKMGVIKSCAMSNLCIFDPDLTYDVPNDWTLQEAATVPYAYTICYYAMHVKGRMKKGETILIHDGSDSIGQAAINLALKEGCKVFVTDDTLSKRRFIRDKFPQISTNHICSLCNFEHLIKKRTNGRGVDMVISSFSRNEFKASLQSVSQGGRLLKIDNLISDNPLDMVSFDREISLETCFLDAILSGTKECKLAVKSLVQNGMKSGAVKPLNRTIFLKNQIEDAFRYVNDGKHIGKVLIKMRAEKEDLNTSILAMPRFYSRQNSSYIVLGGLGDFGIELVNWLIVRGARNIVITSRTGFKNGYQSSRVNFWTRSGVQVVLIADKDISKYDNCLQVIETAEKLGPVDGIFNLAGTLKYNSWENQTQALFEESFNCKALAAKHMDILSRKICSTLRYFVVFSSISCGRGNTGQTNYGMSNSVMERICEKRVSDGLPGLSIQWGVVKDSGLVAEMHEEHIESIIGGTYQRKLASCIHVLDQFLSLDKPVVSYTIVAKHEVATGGSVTAVDAALNTLGLRSLRGVNVSRSFAELGMDSMTRIELKIMLEDDFDIVLDVEEILNLNFAKLKELSEQKKK